MKAGGGILGLIVVLAAIFLPKLLGGGTSSAHRHRPRSDAGCRRRDGDASARPSSSRSLCGAVDDVSEYWIVEYPQAFGGSTARPTRSSSAAASNTGLRPGQRPDRAVLLPGRRAGVLRPRLPDPAADTSSAPPATSPPSTSSPTSTATTCRTCSASAAEVSRLQQQDPARPTATRWRSSCRPTASPAPGRGPPTSAACSTQGEISEALNAAAAVGDDRIQPQAGKPVNPDSFTHGTSEQRVSVVPPRLRHRRPDRCTTFQEL